MTAQIHERLIYEGEETSMAFCPPLPYHSRLSEVDLEQADRIFLSTACWRGYLGTWEIRDDLFYLVRLEGRLRLEEGPALLADWFSGTLRIPNGPELIYVHMDFETVYEEEIHIKIEEGVVVEKQFVDNRNLIKKRHRLGRGRFTRGENRLPGDTEI